MNKGNDIIAAAYSFYLYPARQLNNKNRALCASKFKISLLLQDLKYP